MKQTIKKLNQLPPEGGNGVKTAVAEVTPTRAMPTSAVRNTPQKPSAVGRKPTASELAQSFDMTADDDSFIDSTPDTKVTVESTTTAAKPVELDQSVVKKEEPVITAPVKKEEPAAKASEAKVELKKELEAKADEVEKGPNLLGKLPKKDSSTRDYTGFSDQEQYYLKNMSKEAFEYVAPLIKRKKEFESGSNTQYFQHPEAYTLHPDYKRATSEMQYAQTEARAWNDQLMKIKAGEEWTPLTGVDPKTGAFVYGQARKPTLQDEEMVRMSMNKCFGVAQQADSALRQMPSQFQNVVKQDQQVIQAERAKRFDWVANPELLKHELEIPNLGKKSVESIRNDFIGLFPPYLRNSSGVEVAADLWVMAQIQSIRLNSAEAGKAVAETIKDEVKRVEPNSSTRQKTAAASKFGIDTFDLDGLPT